MIRMTKTYAKLEVSSSAYREIADKLRAAGDPYDEFVDGDGIRLDGICLVEESGDVSPRGDTPDP